MKRVVLFVLIISIIPFSLISASDFKIKKDLDVPAETTYEFNLISLGGNINIKGNFKYSVILFGGKLTLDGEMGEDIICVGSEVKIGKNALIKGDLFVIGGKLDKDAGARVNGDFTYFRFDLKEIESTLLPMISDVRTVNFFKILKIFLWLIITLVVFAITPQKINDAEGVFENQPVKLGFLGVFSIFSFVFLIFISILLSFVLIGIPILFFLILAYFTVYIFGRTVVFYFIGDKIAGGLGLKKIPPSLFILFGVALYGILMFIPVIGPILLILLNIFEVGVGVGFFLRKKLRLAGL